MLFEIVKCGDPHNKHGWNVREYKQSFNEPTCIHRGDLSPHRGRDATIRMLRRMYRGCVVRVNPSGI